MEHVFIQGIVTDRDGGVSLNVIKVIEENRYKEQ